MAGLEREPPGIKMDTQWLAGISLRCGLKLETQNTRSSAVVSISDKPYTASLSGMQCMHDGHVG